MTGLAYGTATITVSVAAGTNYTAPASKQCSVTVTCSTIRWKATAGLPSRRPVTPTTGPTYGAWATTKAVTINGTVQGFTFSNLTVQAFITGFNHNSSREGNHKIHFQLGKISTSMWPCATTLQ